MNNKTALEIAATANDRILITGQVDAHNAQTLFDDVIARFNDSSTLRVDLSGIHTFNTVLLAVLCGWVRFARNHNKSLSFVNVDRGMRAIAALSQVDDWLFGKSQKNKKG